MLLGWNEYRKQLVAEVKEVGQLSSDIVKGYVELRSAGQKKDLLGAKIRVLIALAVAVTRHGDVTVHADAALRHGATREEVAEALRVVAAVNAGVRRRQLGTEQGFPRTVGLTALIQSGLVEPDSAGRSHGAMQTRHAFIASRPTGGIHGHSRESDRRDGSPAGFAVLPPYHDECPYPSYADP
jgi:AhpD family alkylhydroperoxidase